MGELRLGGSSVTCPSLQRELVSCRFLIVHWGLCHSSSHSVTLCPSVCPSSLSQAQGCRSVLLLHSCLPGVIHTVGCPSCHRLNSGLYVSTCGLREGPNGVAASGQLSPRLIVQTAFPVVTLGFMLMRPLKYLVRLP